MNIYKQRPLGITVAIGILLIVAVFISLYLINTYFAIIFLRKLGPIKEMGVSSFLFEGTVINILFWTAGLGLYFENKFAELVTYSTIIPFLYIVFTNGISIYPLVPFSNPLFFVRIITDLYIFAILVVCILPSIFVFKNRKFLKS